MTVITPEQVTDARRSLGQHLAARRETAGLTQLQLARLVGYTRSTIANVETGRSSQPRGCWVRYDELLRADGSLLAGHDHYRALVSRYRDQAAQERERQRTARIEQWRCAHAVATDVGGGTEDPAVTAMAGHGTSAYLRGYEARCRLLIGDAQAAAHDLQLVLSEWPATQRLDEGLFRANLAVALARSGEPEAAEGAAAVARSLGIETGSRRTLAILEELTAPPPRPLPEDEARTR